MASITELNALYTLASSIITALIAALATYFGTKYKANIELQKQREVHEVEIRKIQEQAIQEVERYKAEVAGQAELYEKRAQTDFVKNILDRALAGDTSTISNLEKLSKQVHSGKYKNKNHPAKKKR